MITLVYGGSSSGKSEFAEELVCKSDFKKRYYLATMKSKEDTKERIFRHRKQRAGKGFFTLEYAVDVAKSVGEMEKTEAKEDNRKEFSRNERIVLLECMSNLVANEMFRNGKMISSDLCEEKILSEIKELEGQVASLVIVTNNVFEDGISYDAGTKEYLRCLGRINQRLTELSDEVYEVVVGIGIKL